MVRQHYNGKSTVTKELKTSIQFWTNNVYRQVTHLP